MDEGKERIIDENVEAVQDESSIAVQVSLGCFIVTKEMTKS